METNIDANSTATYKALSQTLFHAEPNKGPDAIARLQALNRRELANALDTLSSALEHRMKLIEERLKSALQSWPNS